MVPVSMAQRLSEKMMGYIVLEKRIAMRKLMPVKVPVIPVQKVKNVMRILIPVRKNLQSASMPHSKAVADGLQSGLVWWRLWVQVTFSDHLLS